MREQQYAGNSVENESASTDIASGSGNEMLVQAETPSNQAESYSIQAHLEVLDWLDSIELRPRSYFDPLMLVAIVYPLWTALSLPWYALHNEFLFVLLFTGVIPAAIIARISRLRREAREDQLADLTDVNWIGPLIKALVAPNSRRRAAAHRVLPALLASLKSTDVGLLDSTLQADLIYSLRLNRPRDMDLNVAIIKALERVGDGAALTALEYAADTPVLLPSQRFVQRTAKSSVPRLDARLAKCAGGIADTAVVKRRSMAVPAPKQRESVPEVDALKERLKKEQDGRTAPGMRRPFLIAAWAILLPSSLWLAFDSFANKELWLAAGYGTLFALVTQLPRYVLSQEQAIAAQRLAAFDNVQGVGPLAAALEWPDPAIKATAERSLIRLLPLLNASDISLLTPAQRGCLHRVLRMGNAKKHEALITAILKALEQVGDESAVPHVRQLAYGHARSRVQQRVQDRARECLPFLEAGASQRQGSQTLLRASSVDSTQPDVLLRSAPGASVTEHVQLLRAGGEGE